jgi:hypothetical protein
MLRSQNNGAYGVAHAWFHNVLDTCERDIDIQVIYDMENHIQYDYGYFMTRIA